MDYSLPTAKRLINAILVLTCARLTEDLPCPSRIPACA